MKEIERTYLAKSIPEQLRACLSKEVVDIYFPESSAHPKIRLRKSGERYELTKKQPIRQGDASRQEEQTITLTEQEFNEFSKLPGKRVSKTRYLYDHQGRTAEVDMFKEKLAGLVLVDFEFETIEEKDAFAMPDFCLADVTDEEFIAGGMLCGKGYEDIEKDLKRFAYSKLFLDRVAKHF